MLKRSCLFCVKTPPELAGSRAQMALCSKPSANEQIERDGKGGVGLWQGHRGGARDFFLGGGPGMMGVFFSWHGYRSVSTDVLITSHLQASSVLTGQQGANTCDSLMISSIANRSDVQQCAAVLHIHYTILCINRSMGMHASICIETVRMCHTSVTLQNNQTAQSSPGSVKTVDGGQDDDTAGVICLHPL